MSLSGLYPVESTTVKAMILIQVVGSIKRRCLGVFGVTCFQSANASFGLLAIRTFSVWL